MEIINFEMYNYYIDKIDNDVCEVLYSEWRNSWEKGRDKHGGEKWGSS